MTTVSQPSVTSAIIPASTVVQNEAQKILFVGQTSSGATVLNGELAVNIGLNQEDILFGEGSMLSAMIRGARKVNEVNQFDAIALDDNGSGVQATSTITFTGTAAASGEIEVIVGSEKDNTYTVVVADTNTETEVGDALVALIDADAKASVTASNAAGVVTLTAINAGTLANGFAISVSPNETVAGISNALTAFTGGSGNPDVSGIFDVIGDNRYYAIVWPYWDGTDEVTDLLQDRWNATDNVLDGIAFTSSVQDLASATARLDLLNYQTLVDFVDKQTDETYYKGPAQPEISYVKSSIFAATRALRLSNGEPISQYVLSANGPLDAFGGPALASKPYFNTATPDLPLIGIGRGWTRAEIEQLASSGGSVLGVTPSGSSTVVGEVVTTYKTDIAGNQDISFKYLNYADTMTNIREYYFNNLRARFAQSRLSEGDVVPGRDVATPSVIASFCTGLYSDLQSSDFTLVEAGEDSLNFYKGNLFVTVDKSTGTANITSKVLIVTQLRVIQQTIQLSFTAEG